MAAADPPLPRLIEHLFRRHYAKLVAGLTRVLGPGRLDLVEDVVQESLVRAMRLWPYHGVPERPEAWLARVARNLATDALRRRSTAAKVEDDLRRWAEAAQSTAAAAVDEVADDTLRMIFTCCHPELPPETRVALTLKTLCGFGVSEIASALLQKAPTIAQRLVRAKNHLQDARVEFQVPAAAELGPRLESVLEVLYLMFNEGYRVHRGESLVRVDLVQEAVRLTGLLLEMPQTRRPAVHALLALMLLLGARLPARIGDVGELLTLARQDRSLWDRHWLQVGFHHFSRSIAGEELTPYHLEAAIASCHAAAPTYESTDWRTILDRYDLLVTLRDTAVVRLNRAVAIAKVHGADAALAELDALAGDRALRGYFLLPSTQAQLLWTRGDRAAAVARFHEALALECTGPERQFLAARLRDCEAGEPAPPF